MPLTRNLLSRGQDGRQVGPAARQLQHAFVNRLQQAAAREVLLQNPHLLVHAAVRPLLRQEREGGRRGGALGHAAARRRLCAGLASRAPPPPPSPRGAALASVPTPWAKVVTM